MNKDYDFLIVGSGLSGIVIAERLSSAGKRVHVVDKRNHVGGNCYDYVNEYDILMNMYGAHLFHTNDEEVWNYINQFATWHRWDHKVLALVNNRYVNIPVNIHTVNTLFNLKIANSKEMEDWLFQNQINYDLISDSEQMAKSRVGEKLYNLLIKDYTFKQWNKYPNELDASVLARIPVRNNHDERYFDDRFQALPEKGYTHFFNAIIEKANIEVQLNTDFFDVKDQISYSEIIYTGPIDAYFKSAGMPKLEYRSIEFHIENYENIMFYQPNSVVNYPQKNVEYTRCVEYKHFLNQQSPHTTVVKETTTDTGEPYYPVPTKRNAELYSKYQRLAEQEPNVHFIGRLASYKYFNMDQAIRNALDYFDKFLNR